MSVKADGTLLIETGVDLEGFETDCRKLQQRPNVPRNLYWILKKIWNL